MTTRAIRRLEPIRFTIYKITFVTDGRLYVGQTKRSLIERWADHKRYVRLGIGYRIHSAIRKYGLAAFKIEMIEELTSQEEADQREEFWIRHYDSVRQGFNLNYGPKDYASMGKVSWSNMDSEERDKRAKSNGAATSAWWSSLSDDEKAELKEIRKKRSVEARNHPLIKKQSSEAHKKQWANKTQKELETLKLKFSMKKRKHYIVTDPEGKDFEIFGLKNFCDEFKLHQGAMNAVAQGKYSHYKGWKCRYV